MKNMGQPAADSGTRREKRKVMGEVCRSDLWGNRQEDADGPNGYAEK